MLEKQKKDRFLGMIEPLKNSLYGYSKNMLWDRNDIEDVIQSSILAAYKSFDRFTEGTNFRAWIFACFTNTIFSFNKRHEKISNFEIKLENIDEESIAEMLELESDYSTVSEEPEKILEKVSDKMKDSIKLLSSPERSVFLLRSIEDMSYKDISNVLKIPIGTVMSHLSRVRASLRKLLCNYARETGFIKK